MKSTSAFGETTSRACAALAAMGSIAVVAADLIGLAVNERVGFVADTISDLAAGRHAWIQDVGLYAFAAGLLALAAGLLRFRFGRWSWWIGAALLALLAIAIVVIGAHGEYGDRDVGGLVIHIYVVVALGIGFATVGGLLASGLSRIEGPWSRINGVLVVIWIVAAPVFFVVPTSWDGLYERGVAGVLLIWTLTMAAMISRPRAVEPPALRSLDDARLTR